MTWKSWTNNLATESSAIYTDKKHLDESVIYCGFTVGLFQQRAASSDL